MTRLHIKFAAHKNLAVCGVWTKDFVVIGEKYDVHEKPLCKNCLKSALFKHGRTH